MKLYLPFPPSVNGLYSGKARRFKSPDYKTWCNAAGWKLKTQKLPDKPIGECHVEIHLVRPDRRIRDCANYEKAVTDLLVDMGVLMDDSLIQRNTQLWTHGNFECMVLIAPCL